MTRGILRSFGIAVVTSLVLLGVDYWHFALFCEKHLAWIRVHANASAVVRDTGFDVARPGDAIYTCTTIHCFGPLGCHDDLGCYCAPRTFRIVDVERLVGGACAVDKPVPLPSDAFGACRYARCDEHVGSSS